MIDSRKTKSTTRRVLALFAAITLTGVTAHADELLITSAPGAALSVSQSETVVDAVKDASHKWISAFNAGDAAAAAAQYTEDAVMVAKPFGTFTGREAIEGFWTNLIAGGFDDVEYILPNLEVLDEKNAVLSSGWRMNKAFGVITKELWVIQSDGNALLVEDHFEVLANR